MPGRGNPNTPNTVPRIRAQYRARKVLKLRVKGWSLEDIAENLDITVDWVRRILRMHREKLNERSEESIRVLRDQMDQQLDLMMRPALEKAVEGDLEAIRTVLKIMDRRAKLFGMDEQRESDKPMDALAAAVTHLLKQREPTGITFDVDVIDVSTDEGE